MIFAAHDDHSIAAEPPARPSVPGDVPTARPGVDVTPVDGPTRVPVPLDIVPPSTFRVTGAADTDADLARHLECVAAEVRAGAQAVTWALRLALLGVIGLVVVLLTVL